MADHLTDEEQLQQLKDWWKNNGTSLLAAVLLGLIAYFGFQWWQNHEQMQGEQASALYSELQDALQTQNNAALTDEKKSTAKYLIQQLKENYKSSQYATNASLLEAKIFVESQNLEDAAASLLWAVEHADEHLRSLAQLRLVRVWISQEKYDDALGLLNEEKDEKFVSLNAELRGDIFVAQEKWAAAREAYQKAIDSLDGTASFRGRLLPIKLANLPVGAK